MMNDTEIWLERLNSLYKSQIRQAVSLEGLPFVHFEILQYLSICNDYSNTAKAVSNYLGQTKGSISQSLKTMEKLGYVKRQASSEDKRVTKIHLTPQGEKSLKNISEKSELSHHEDDALNRAIKGILLHWQVNSQKQGFGQCLSCSYNESYGKAEFKCGLTKESLSKLDIRKICQEHRFDAPIA